jgi:hypothetical protein
VVEKQFYQKQDDAHESNGACRGQDQGVAVFPLMPERLPFSDFL